MVDGSNDVVFVYLGGDQFVPDGVTHAIIDPSVSIVSRWAFCQRRQLVSAVFLHDGVERIEFEAFYECESLRGLIKLLGVREIGDNAFRYCFNLTGVVFGDKLETIGSGAFCRCSLKSIKIPSVRTVQPEAFRSCFQLTDVEFGIDLEIIGCHSFHCCPNLRRIAIPLKHNLFTFDSSEHEQSYNQFEGCKNLTKVDIVGADGIHNTISSLLIESWKDEMKEEFDRINRELPSTHMDEKTDLIRLWVRSVINRLDHYKAEHNRLLKEHMTQLELAVWKAKLREKEHNSTRKGQAKRANKIEEESTRRENRITAGADIIIKNVLPFLQLA